MLGRALLICPLLATLPLVPECAEQGNPQANSAILVPEKNGAERVFASAASKVVFLIARNSGELRARASGIILTADGYIATNYHALEGADAIEVRFFPNPEDSENYQSFNGTKLLYADALRDIAVLKVNSKTLPFLECVAKTGCVPHVREPVYAIGNPMGLSNTISEGIVSALRSAGEEEVIQHTAAISPGSSGGALLDSSGYLLGMNSWQVANAQNLNFAISTKHLLKALEAARQTTTVLSFPPEAPTETQASAEGSKARNRTAIRAEFVELATSHEKDTIDFWYTLTNTTDADYRIDRLDEITTAGLTVDDSLYGFNQGVSFDPPLIILAHQKTKTILHVTLANPNNAQVSRKTAEAFLALDEGKQQAVLAKMSAQAKIALLEALRQRAERSADGEATYENYVMNFLRSEFSGLKGCVVMDEATGYEIDFPLVSTRIEEKKQPRPAPPATGPQPKVVSFAWADSYGVYLGLPKWADDWVQKNAKKFPALRCSQTPVSGAENYLVVLSASTSMLSGFQPVVRFTTATSTADVSGRGSVTDYYGSIWSYTYQGTATTTTTTMTRQDVPYTLETRTLYASAYGGPLNLLVARNSEWTVRQEGGDPSQALGTNLGGLVRRIRMKTRLLDGVVKDIAKLP